jgi:hypothetical protein
LTLLTHTVADVLNRFSGAFWLDDRAMLWSL